MGIPSVKLPEIQYYQKFFLILSEKLYCCFHIHHQLMFGYIKFLLHSTTLVPNNSFIMLVNILLFQNYSCQICNLLFSKLCQHNRLRPSIRGGSRGYCKVTFQTYNNYLNSKAYT